MKVLALDTASSTQSAALVDSDRVIACLGLDAGRGGSDRVLALVKCVLDLAGTTVQSIDAVSVSRGPGSLTGLRVGIGTARGIALGAGRPLVGVSTLRAIAAGCGTGPPVLALVDAGRGEVYGALYTPGRPPLPRGAERVAPPEWFAEAVAGRNVRIAGSGAARYQDRFAESAWFPAVGEEFLAAGIGRLASALIDLEGGCLELRDGESRQGWELDPHPRYLTHDQASIRFEG